MWLSISKYDHQLVGLEGKITGKSHVSWENLWFQVKIFPWKVNRDHPWLEDSHHVKSWGHWPTHANSAVLRLKPHAAQWSLYLSYMAAQWTRDTNGRSFLMISHEIGERYSTKKVWWEFDEEDLVSFFDETRLWESSSVIDSFISRYHRSVLPLKPVPSVGAARTISKRGPGGLRVMARSKKGYPTGGHNGPLGAHLAHPLQQDFQFQPDEAK